jgi:hypothetical protein
MNKSDRRKMERFDLNLPAKLSWTGKYKDQKSIELMTNNICAGGAYLITDRPIPKGTDIKMDLILKLDRLNEFEGQQTNIDISGFVIRTDQQGMAIRFNKKYSISTY